MTEKIVNGYYQTNIKTSRNEDSVYAMRYANQQMLIDKLQQENQELKQKYEMQKDSNKLLCKAITCDDCNCSVCEAHKENIKLKKQLEDTNEELELVRCDLHNRTSERDGYCRNIEKLENQQKEFINKIKELETKLKENLLMSIGK